MRRAITLLALLVVVSLAFGKGRKSELPDFVTKARFVHVTTYHGSGFANARLTPEERKAIADMEGALRKWGRYSVTMNERDADIVLLVRPAGQVMVSGGPNIGIGSDGRPRVGGGIGSEVASSPDDMLAVYSSTSGVDSAPFWRRTAHNGFGPDMVLFREFKKAVEDSTKP